MADKKVIVGPGQTMEDIALQEYGSVDAVPIILAANEELLTEGFSTELEPGWELVVPGEPTDPAVLQAMRYLGIIPSTHPNDPGPELGPYGDYNEDHNEDHFIIEDE